MFFVSSDRSQNCVSYCNDSRLAKKVPGAYHTTKMVVVKQNYSQAICQNVQAQN